MTEILTGLEDLSTTPTTERARKLVAALRQAGMTYQDIRDDGKKVVAMADRGEDWYGWIAYTYDYLDSHTIEELVSDLWDWRETDFSQIVLRAD